LREVCMPEMQHDLAAAKSAVAAMTGGNGGFDKKEAAAFIDLLQKEHAEGVQDISVWDAVGQDDPALLAQILKTNASALKTVNRKIKDWQSFSALHRACGNGYLDCAQVLLETGKADVHSKDEDGSTPLHLAVLIGNMAMVEKLVGFHAGTNPRDTDGTTPMMSACGKGDLKMCEFLLSHGAKTDVRDNAGYGALHCAVASGQVEILQFLLDRSSDLQEDIARVDEDGLSLVHICAAGGHADSLRLLLKHGADAQVVDNSGKSPLVWAEEEFEDEVADILREHLKSIPESEKKVSKPRQMWNPDSQKYIDAPADGSTPNYQGTDGVGKGKGPDADDIQGMFASLQAGATPDDLMKQMEEKMGTSTGAKMAAHHDTETSTPLFAQLLSDAQDEAEKERKDTTMPIQPQQPSDPNDTSFIAASSFQGSKQNYVFQAGAKGVGYYLDGKQQTAPATVPAVDLSSANYTQVDELD